VIIDKVEAEEVSALLREYADFVEFFSGESFEIKISVRFFTATGGDKSIEHFVTRNDALFDHESNETIFDLMRRRASLIEQRLNELGAPISVVSAAVVK
jgi:hypothetical protein